MEQLEGTVVASIPAALTNNDVKPEEPHEPLQCKDDQVYGNTLY